MWYVCGTDSEIFFHEKCGLFMVAIRIDCVFILIFMSSVKSTVDCSYHLCHFNR